MVEEAAVFPAEPESVGGARRFVRGVLSEWGLDACEADVSQLVTELATNSVIHGRSSFEVAMSFGDDTLRLSVADRSRRVPTRKSHTVQAMTGRGMHLVAAFADSWGIEQRSSGKAVWCVLRTRSAFPVGSRPALDGGARRGASAQGDDGAGGPAGDRTGPRAASWRAA